MEWHYHQTTRLYQQSLYTRIMSERLFGNIRDMGTLGKRVEEVVGDTAEEADGVTDQVEE
jgi:hypothetical protein